MYFVYTASAATKIFFLLKRITENVEVIVMETAAEFLLFGILWKLSICVVNFIIITKI